MKINIKVTNPDDWKKYFPPAGKDKQWKDGYSALEFAKIVTGAYGKNGFEKKLKSVFGNSFCILPDEIYPERLSRFDNRNGPRHHDLACRAKLDGKPVVMCFEAKVFEPLDKTLEKYITSKGKKERCDELCESFFGKKYEGNEVEFKDVFFQILSSVAGTIAFASENIDEELPEAYFVLYQIIPDYQNNKKVLENKSTQHTKVHKDALNAFIKFSGIEGNISKSGSKTEFKKFTIPRKGKDGKAMKANISIVYIEHEVSGEKLD